MTVFVRFVVGFFALNALIVLAAWGMLLGGNPFPEWLVHPRLAASVPPQNVLAEVLMALLAFVGAGYALAGHGWGWPLVLFSAGMFFYGAIANLPLVANSHPLLTVPMIVTAGAAAILAAYYMARDRRRADL